MSCSGATGLQQIMRRERWLRAFLRVPRPVRASRSRGPAAPSTAARPRGGARDWPAAADAHAAGPDIPATPGAARGGGVERLAGWSPSGGSAEPGDPIERLGFDTQEYEFALRLPELLLMRIDRFAMAHGVEARVPFLDPELVSYAYRVPFECKMRGATGSLS